MEKWTWQDLDVSPHFSRGWTVDRKILEDDKMKTIIGTTSPAQPGSCALQFRDGNPWVQASQRPLRDAEPEPLTRAATR